MASTVTVRCVVCGQTRVLPLNSPALSGNSNPMCLGCGAPMIVTGASTIRTKGESSDGSKESPRGSKAPKV
jgi:hypothetical protein